LYSKKLIINTLLFQAVLRGNKDCPICLTSLWSDTYVKSLKDQDLSKETLNAHSSLSTPSLSSNVQKTKTGSKSLTNIELLHGAKPNNLQKDK